MGTQRPSPRALFVAATLAAFVGGALMAALGEHDAFGADPKVEAVLCKRLDNRKPAEVTDKFSKDTQTIYGYWKSGKLALDTVVRTVWIATDVGSAAPPNTKIIEKTARAADDPSGQHASWWDGTFFVTRPTNGWPAGKYRAEIYFNDKLIKTLPFTIE